MKARYSIVISLILGLFVITGCGDKNQKAAINSFEDELKEIEQIEERSEGIQSADEAFKLIRDLNKSMKSVRDAVLNLDTEYAELQDEGKKKQIEKRFSEANEKLDASLKTISKNIEPYKDNERVKPMIEKLNDVLISK